MRTVFQMATQHSAFHQKIDVYKQFFRNPAIRRLIVCGEGGTGKSLALKFACNEADTHPPLELVYTGEPSVSIPMKDYTESLKKYIINDDRDYKVKTIVHSYTFNEGDYNNETQIVMFNWKIPSNLSE